MSEDRRYSRDGCECGDAWCAGCDDPQIQADLDASRLVRVWDEVVTNNPNMR